MPARRVLAIGAHPDDIELGCGGALARHVADGDEVGMLVVTRGEVGPGETLQRVAEQHRAVDVLGVQTLIWGRDIADCQVSLHELELVHQIEDAIARVQADIVYTHSVNDSHQDHRAVALCTTGAARHVSTVLSYGAPSALAFTPTTFVDITEVLEVKIEALLCHATQVQASEMVSASRVRSTAEHWGHQCRRPFAEGFEPVRAMVFEPVRDMAEPPAASRIAGADPEWDRAVAS
ncbi:PIG-L deacetylase family protein [Gryllotalpicola ginsengisoli]|uniref:PIG-L deacetylase family protein n=1 Tax=Gryllotalpicola ginsengisoli TaxID=444608 RepID=UPI0003B42771|nr:PIG-L deacetylase family protein [Gryllotalpicola ginsengisoli]